MTPSLNDGLPPYELAPKDLAEAVRQDHLTTIQKRKPFAKIYGFERHGGFEHIQSVLRLPLSDDGESVNQIVVIVELTDKGIDYWKDAANGDTASS